MSRAFIFDMDGVITDTERMWRKICGSNPLVGLFGEEIARKIGDLAGMSVNTVYEKAIAHGASMDYGEYLKRYDEKAALVYSEVSITEGIEELVEKLISWKFELGLVSSARGKWIDYVLSRLSFRDKFRYVVSINDRPDLKPKPDPAGYLEALKQLKADPKLSIVLEDSNSGIQAAKAAGVHVVAFRGNLVEGYQQRGADAYADTMKDVIKLVELFAEQNRFQGPL